MAIARNGEHYILHGDPTGFRSMDWTRKGLTELSRFQRALIEIAFQGGYLGASYEFAEIPEGIEDYEPASECITQGDEEKQGDGASEVESSGYNEALCDHLFDQGREESVMGEDTALARMYNKARGR
jgi:hypothetical protein